MPDGVLERMVEDFLSYRFPVSVFSWQGGEPTLAGLDFFKQVVELQKKHGVNGQSVGNSIQTNGVLIDDDWASFFNKYKFLIGVSLDGPRDVHDRYRMMVNGSSSWRKTMDCIELLRKHNVEFSILCVVNNVNVQDGVKLYRWFIGNGIRNLQFIPCVERDPDTGRITEFSVGPTEFGKFLIDVFDEWKKRDIGRVFVRTFDSLLTYLVSGEHVFCVFGDDCHRYLLVEQNGDVYPCDFFVEEGWKLGNVVETSLGSMFESEKEKEFASHRTRYSDECGSCRWVEFCGGGCQKERLDINGNPARHTYLCDSYKMFFSHAYDDLNVIKDKLVKAEKKGVRTVKINK